jgi:hypothetical protein
MCGSLLFAAGSTSTYASWVSSATVALTFVVGSVFFTSAAYLQLLSVLNPGGSVGPWRLWSWQPKNADWWASAIQLVGALLFNINTYDAFLTHLSRSEEMQFVWVPDFIGSVCFLVASWLGLRDLRHAPLRERAKNLVWWSAGLNMVGSITFGIAAAGALFQIEGDLVGTTIADEGTFAGAVCFFFGAWLLWAEGSC